MGEYNYHLDIEEWAKVAVAETWPDSAKDYADVPYLVNLNDRMIDCSNEIDVDADKIIGSIFIDMFHLLCMRDVTKTFKSLQIMSQSIEKEVMRDVLRQLRDALNKSMADDDDDIPEDRPQQQREKGY